VRPREAANFEEWVTDHFGRRLFELFFKQYTEKVWGIPCTEIGAEWASQRIKGLDLARAIWNAVARPRNTTIKTLADEFLFPRRGAGQFYEKMAGRITRSGVPIRTGCRVVRLVREGSRLRGVVVEGAGGSTETIEARYILSSAPLTETVQAMEPKPPEAVLAASRTLRFRHHIGVHLTVSSNPFPDNWIYVHAKERRMARIANYRNFSRDMAGGEGATPLTVEYFAFSEDDIWRKGDEELAALAAAELGGMRLVDPGSIRSAFVVRSERAYPVLDRGSAARVEAIRSWLERLENFLPIGRCGMFRYNNQDHAIATGLLAARTALGLGRFDPWLVNIDAEYHEGAPAA